MKNYLLLLIIVMLGFFACKSESDESSKQEKNNVEVEDTSLRKIDKSTLENYISKWNEAHNSHDTSDLRRFYGDWVFYYRKEMEKNIILKDKAKAFAKQPDFQQEIIGNIRIVENNGSQICYFTKKVRANNKVQNYPAYLELLLDKEKGYQIVTEGDSVTDILIQKRKHLISDKIKVKNGNIFLYLDNQKERQITNLGADTMPILSADKKKIVFLRQDKKDEIFSLIVHDIDNEKDTIAWQDFYLSIVYFDSAYNRVFVNGHGPMGCCMAVGVLNVNLYKNETKPICAGRFGSPILKGENKGKYSFVQCGYYGADKGGCWEQTWLYDEKLKAVKALDKKHDMEW